MTPALPPAVAVALRVAAALALAALLSSTPLLQRVDLWLGDLQQRLLAPRLESTDTVVVDIDEESLRKLEPYLGTWPYRRDVFAVVADYLFEAGVRAVAFDILMSEGRAGDPELARAIARNPGVSLAALAHESPLGDDAAQRNAARQAVWPVPADLPADAWTAFMLPAPALLGREETPVARVGVASVRPDIDGTVRRLSLFHRSSEISLPSLALAPLVPAGGPPAVAYDAERRIGVGDRLLPVDAGGRVRLDFAADPQALRTVPFHTVALAALAGPGAASAHRWLAGRTVFVGSTALQADTLHTPRGLMPGVHLLAWAHESIARGLVLKPAGPGAVAVLVAVALAFPLVPVLRRRASPKDVGIAVVAGAAVAVLGSLVMLGLWRQLGGLTFALCALVLAGGLEIAVLVAADARRRRHAENQMRTAAAVFEASREGILVTDAEDRIVSINPAFTTITGFAADEVLGQTPRVLSSGRHDRAFYEAMWQSILADGYWQGEIWNRRKNGETYPQWLSINSVTGPDGRIEKRIAVFSDMTSRKAAEEKIAFLAHFDPLTNLPNRTLLRDRANVGIAAASRAGEHLAVMFLDLDRFENVNDSLGHQVGDQLLRQLAQRLTGLLRDTDTASRLGGDEFGLLLPETASEGAAHVAERLLETVARPFVIDGHELTLTASIGVATYPENGADLDELSRCADSALHRAKQAGRNRFQFYTPEMHERAREVLTLENELRHAIERDELLLHYQPQVDATSGRLVGLEALVRWQHPRRGIVPPAQFIPVAEDSGQIREIGDWVLRRALAQIGEWSALGLPLVPVAVNLSLAQFRQPALCDRLIAAVHASGVAAGLLELELTETMAMENVDLTVDSMARMREFGVGLAIDDFGTGYSSLSYLKRFAVHKIKIDQSFVQSLTVGKDDESIVTAIIHLAHNLGFRVIAEGVETRAQLEFLRTHGCDEIQGYLFRRPLPAEDIVALLRQGVVGHDPL